MDLHTLWLGLLIFFARLVDVSMGTIRTIAIVQGRSVLAFFMGFVEVTIWITIVSTVVNHIRESPLLAVFYAFGFAVGNVLGIIAERRLAFGMMVLRVITRDKGPSMADRLRAIGQAVTVFQGEGMHGPVSELYIATRRRDLSRLLQIVEDEDPDCFYITEQARDVSKMIKPVCTPLTGWRAVWKKK